jgi:predicted GNAT family N-acyltransferase
MGAQMRENGNANKTLSISLPDGRIVYTRQLPLEALDAVYELNSAQLDATVADIEVARGVLAQNSDAFWAVYCADDARGKNQKLVGYASFLMLNTEGAIAIRDGSFDRGNPPLSQLVPTGQRPAAVYMWAIVAKKFGATAIPLTTHAIGALYRGLPVYGTAATDSGRRALLNYGFTPLCEGKDGLGEIFWSDNSTIGGQSTRNSPPVQTSRFQVHIGGSGDEVQKAFAIRAAVFMAEQACPYDEEFDGNDHTATHVVGLVDGEPAATLRIRYFAEFVKIERLAVLPRYRGTLIAKEVVEAAISFCRRKGYRRMYGHAQKRLLSFWGRYGFRPIDGADLFNFSDHEYVEVEGELPPHASAITTRSGPAVFLRPEGRWDVPCVLEHSAARPATNPH